jgi:hypothetical protein
VSVPVRAALGVGEGVGGGGLGRPRQLVGVVVADVVGGRLRGQQGRRLLALLVEIALGKHVVLLLRPHAPRRRTPHRPRPVTASAVVVRSVLVASGAASTAKSFKTLIFISSI